MRIYLTAVTQTLHKKIKCFKVLKIHSAHQNWLPINCKLQLAIRKVTDLRLVDREWVNLLLIAEEFNQLRVKTIWQSSRPKMKILPAKSTSRCQWQLFRRMMILAAADAQYSRVAARGDVARASKSKILLKLIKCNKLLNRVPGWSTLLATMRWL